MKKLISLALCLSIVVTFFTGISVFAEDPAPKYSGKIYTWASGAFTTTESGAEWALYENADVEGTYTLKVTGTGACVDYGSEENSRKAPWLANGVTKANITAVEWLTTDKSQIGSYTFAKYTGLKTVDISETTTALAWNSFLGCTALTTITGGEGITALRNGALNDCKSLTTNPFKQFPALAKIEGASLGECNSAVPETVVIPKTFTDFVGNPFQNCTSIKTLIFEEGCNFTLSKGAFSNTKNLKTVKLASGMNVTANQPLHNENVGSANWNAPSNMVIYAAKDSAVANQLKTDLANKEVYSATSYPQKPSLVELVINPNNKTINYEGLYPFASGYGYYTIDTDGELNISGYGDIKALPYGNTMPWDQDAADTVKKAVFHSGITNIPKYMFGQKESNNITYDNLAEVVLPEGITSIEYRAFSSYGKNNKGKSLKVTGGLPSTLVTIGPNAFSGTALAFDDNKLVIPASVTKIDKNAFQNNSTGTYYTSIEFEPRTTPISIGDTAFSFLDEVKYIQIPQQATLGIKTFMCNSQVNNTVVFNGDIPTGWDASTANPFGGRTNIKGYIQSDATGFTDEIKTNMTTNWNFASIETAKLTAVTTENTENKTAKATFNNYTNTQQPYVILYAAYNSDGALVDVDYIEGNVAPFKFNVTPSVSATLSDLGVATKVFVWNSLNMMKPIF